MPTVFMIGGTGFIGRAVVSEALERGFQVRALARSESAASSLRSAGAEPVRGDAQKPSWIEQARGADVLIDLVQPSLPKRMSRRAMRGVAAERTVATAAVLAALERLPGGERPVYFSISGADDLDPDGRGVISHESALRSGDSGFAVIGVPVRRLVEGSGVEAAFVHFGVMVYGPGKSFADIYVKGLRKGRAAVIGAGENRLPLTHVSDAARALVHLAGLRRGELAGSTFLAADGSDTTQGQLFDQTAELMGVKRPRRVPAAIAGLVGGPVAAEAMTFDAHADNSALIESGFKFRYPSPREGLPPTLEELGELGPHVATADVTPSSR
jgi:nucleoside-diphosphate-sugar epimerase